jgi:hypothetical protein
MNRNISTSFLSAIFVLSISTTAYSNSLPKPLEMSQVKINKPFPYKAAIASSSDSMASQLGFYTFEAPNTSDSKLPFQHYQVAINHNSRLVYYVSATKPYSLMNDCIDSLKDVVKNLSSLYSITSKDFDGSRLMKKSGDNIIEGSCIYAGLSPFAELSLAIKSDSQNKEIQNNMKKKYAR